MPLTKDELQINEFYQDIATRDELEYEEGIKVAQNSGNIDDGILRGPLGQIFCFEKLIRGQGTDGSSHPEYYLLEYTDEFFVYEENEELSAIIDREFKEF